MRFHHHGNASGVRHSKKDTILTSNHSSLTEKQKMLTGQLYNAMDPGAMYAGGLTGLNGLLNVVSFLTSLTKIILMSFNFTMGVRISHKPHDTPSGHSHA